MGSNPQVGLISSLPPLKAVKVLEQLRERIRYLHYSRRTEEVVVHWCRDFICFNGVRHAVTLEVAEVDAYLCALAVERRGAQPLGAPGPHSG